MEGIDVAAKFEYSAGQQLVWVTCRNHKRPSKLYAFIRDLEGDGKQAEWHEFPANFPPASAYVDDDTHRAEFAFSPEALDLEQRRPRYKLQCERCGAGPLVFRHARMSEILSNVAVFGEAHLDLQGMG